MATAAAAWLDALDPAQRAVATGAAPSADAESDAERRRWFYTPTDHGGLTLTPSGRPSSSWPCGSSPPGSPRPGTSPPPPSSAWTTCSTGPRAGRSTGAASGAATRACTTCGCSASRAARGRGAGGSAATTSRSTTSSSTARSARPPRASSAPTRRPPRCSAARRCGRWPGPRTWPASSSARWTRTRPPGPSCSTGRPSDIVGANRSQLSEGDELIHLRDIWRGLFADPRLLDMITRAGDAAEQASGYDAADHQRVALTSAPKGLPATALERRAARTCCARSWPPTWAGSRTGWPRLRR